MSTPSLSSSQPDRENPTFYPGLPLHPSDPYKRTAHVMAAVFTLTLPVLIGVILLLKPDPSAPRGMMLTGGSVAGAQAAAGGPAAEPQTPVEIGRATYKKSCVVCHGPEGNGITNLGKPLRNSAFVQGHSDDELFTLVVNGRAPDDPANTTGAAMPPRGAQNLTDEEIRDVIAFVRSLQDPSAPPASVEAWNLKSKDGTTQAASIELPDHPGHDLFIASCSACHGTDAAGLPNLGLPLTTSGFVRGKTDKELINFIKSGRPSWDGANTTGVDMPPKGGNPAITDEQLQQIVTYIRALQKKAMGS